MERHKKMRHNLNRFVHDEKRLKVSTEHDESILRGLLNDIISAHVIPKLGWRDFYALSAVNTAWCHAVRSRQVYNERVHAKSTETHILLCNERFCQQRRQIVPAVSVYSMEDDSWSELPLIPPEWGGVQMGIKCLGLNGNVYLLRHNARPEKTLETYVFDLAGQRHWRKCAPVTTDRHFRRYECGVLDGKIYLLAGETFSSSSDPQSLNMVYDPVEDTWSPIQSMRSLRRGHHIKTTQDELFVYGGIGCDEYYGDGWATRMVMGSFESLPATTVQIYHPGTDEWRALDGFNKHLYGEVVVEVQGKLLTLTEDTISSFTLDAGESTSLHSISLQIQLSGPDHAALDGIRHVVAAHAVGDELLAIAILKKSDRDNVFGDGPVDVRTYTTETCLVRCKGVGGQNKTLFWERTKTPSFFPTIGRPSSLSLCSIRL